MIPGSHETFNVFYLVITVRGRAIPEAERRIFFRGSDAVGKRANVRHVFHVPSSAVFPKSIYHEQTRRGQTHLAQET